MATEMALTLHQNNDETIDVEITSDSLSGDLSLVTRLEVVIKPSACDVDDSAYATTLSTDVPTQIAITAQTATQIDATIYIPATALAEPYNRWWRMDAFVGANVRTALYGRAIVVDL